MNSLRPLPKPLGEIAVFLGVPGEKRVVSLPQLLARSRFSPLISLFICLEFLIAALEQPSWCQWSSRACATREITPPPEVSPLSRGFVAPCTLFCFWNTEGLREVASAPPEPAQLRYLWDFFHDCLTFVSQCSEIRTELPVWENFMVLPGKLNSGTTPRGGAGIAAGSMDHREGSVLGREIPRFRRKTALTARKDNDETVTKKRVGREPPGAVCPACRTGAAGRVAVGVGLRQCRTWPNRSLIGRSSRKLPTVRSS